MAEDRLPYCRSLSMPATKSDIVIARELAISLSAFQNASSRLMLVLWPATTTECFTIDDFIALLPLYESRCSDSAPQLLKDGCTIFCGWFEFTHCGFKLPAGAA